MSGWVCLVGILFLVIFAGIVATIDGIDETLKTYDDYLRRIIRLEHRIDEIERKTKE